MCQELALKYSSADPEQLLGILPMEEVLEIIRKRVTQEVEPAIADQYRSQIEDAEEEASEWEWKSDALEDDVIGLSRAIKKAIELPWSQAIPLLQEAMKEYGKDTD